MARWTSVIMVCAKLHNVCIDFDIHGVRSRRNMNILLPHHELDENDYRDNANVFLMNIMI